MTVTSNDLDKAPTMLIVEAALMIREEFRRSAQHLGLTQPQSRVLMQLSMAPGLSQIRLAERLEVHAVTINKIVDRLVTAGWVRREPCSEDRRVVRLYLTEEAGPMMVELNRIADGVRNTALAGLSASQRLQLADTLLRIKSNLSEKSALP